MMDQYRDEDSQKVYAICVLLPTLDHLIILLLCGLGVYVEELP